MNNQLREMYLKCRRRKPFMMVGEDAKCSLSTARTIMKFRELEGEGLVRMRAEPEEENYFDAYGDHGPFERNGHLISKEEWREDMVEILDRDGVWWTVAEWWDGEEWQQADSCGMHAGYSDPLDPFQNCYVVGEMQSAIDALEEHQSELQETEMAQAWP